MFKWLSYILFTLLAIAMLLFFFRVELVNKILTTIHPQLEIKVEKLLIGFSNLKIENLSASHLNKKGQKSSILRLKELSIAYSFQDLWASPKTLESIELHHLTIGLQAALAAKNLDFGNDSSHPSSSSEKPATGYRLNKFVVKDLNFDTKGMGDLQLPPIKYLELEDIQSQHFSSTKEMLSFLVREAVDKIKKAKLLEGLIDQAGSLPQKIIEEGIQSPKQLFELFPKIIDKLENREKQSKEKSSTQNHGDAKPSERVEDILIEELNNVFKGIPEKLFEKK